MQETNARPLARGELESIRASGLPDMTSPAGERYFSLFMCYNLRLSFIRIRQCM